MAELLEAPALAGFVAPAVEVGRIVLFQFSAQDKAKPALVMRSAGRAIDVQVFAENGSRYYDSVRHQSDPDLVRPQIAERGFWEFTARDQQLDRLLLGTAPREEAFDLLPKKKKAEDA